MNAGHDLDLENLVVFRTLPYLDEVSIGHASSATRCSWFDPEHSRLSRRADTVMMALLRSRRPLGLRARVVADRLALIGLAQPQPEAAGRVVSFRLADGRMLSGLWMEAQERPAPAVVLVPMLGRPREEWQVTAQRLAEVNIHALAIDLPGSALPEKSGRADAVA